MNLEPTVIFLVEGGEGGQESMTVEARPEIMANASPVFKVMLAGDKFREGESLRNTGRCEISLPETNAKALQILCRIFHLQGYLVPGMMELSLLCDIATLVDKYDCLGAIQPWPRIWRGAKNLRLDAESADDLSCVLRAIQISSVLQYDDILMASTSCFLKTVTAKHLADKTISQLFNNLVPSVQTLITYRLDTCRTRMRLLVHKTIANLKLGGSCKSTEPVGEADKFHCASMSLGNALLGLSKAFGPDWEDGKQWEKMPIELESPMLTFAHAMKGPKLIRTQRLMIRGHTWCNLEDNLVKKIDQMCQESRKGVSLSELNDALPLDIDLSESDQST